MEVDSEENGAHMRLSLYVFLTIRTAQLQHGLRHGDYERYRKYCSARLERIREKLKITHNRTGRGAKAQSKIPDLHTIADPRVLHIPLMLCERAWAYGMEKKGEQSAMGHSLKRHKTMLRKFNQAVRSANSLMHLCESKCDARTCLEVAGYAEVIRGIAAMESERKWIEALQHFMKARKILEKLAAAAEVEVQSVFLQAMEELEPNIRFCRYELEKRGEAETPPSLEDVEARLRQLEIHVPSKTATVSALSLTWCQNQYPVKNERLSALLEAAQKCEKQIANAAADHATVVSLYEKVIGAYMDMETNIKKALAAGGGVSVFAGEDLEQLQMAVVGKLVLHSIEKTEMQIRRNEDLFQETLIRALTSKKQKGVKVRAETLVRLCDSAIGLVLEQSELGAKLGGEHGEHLIEACTIQASCFQAHRCFYLAHVFRSNGSFPESYALFDRCLERIHIALEQISDLMEGGDTYTPLTQKLHTLQKKAISFKQSSQAEMSVAALNEMRETQKKMEVLQLDASEEVHKGKKAKRPVLPAQKYMAENLNHWESFIGSEGKNIRLFRIPPPLTMIPVRPFILDSTPNHIQKPDLKHRLPVAEEKSVFSKWIPTSFKPWS